MVDFKKVGKAMGAVSADDVVNPDEYKSGGGPKLEIGDFTGDATVAIIAEVERVSFNQDKQPRVGLRIRFQEFGDKGLFVVSKGDVQTLTERLGNRFKAWVGQPVCLEKAIRQFDNKEYHKVVISPADEWDDMLAQMAKPKASGKKAVRRRK